MTEMSDVIEAIQSNLSHFSSEAFRVIQVPSQE